MGLVSGCNNLQQHMMMDMLFTNGILRTGIEWMTLYGLLIGTGVAGTVALCFYIIYKRLANGNRWKRTTFLPATRIKIR